VAHHKDAIKRIRTSEAANARNRANRSRLRAEIKALRALIDAGDTAAAEAALPKAVSTVQKMAGKGIIHSRNAARRISRLATAINGLKKAAAS
jgi:small subunit ribosomal protein S20